MLVEDNFSANKAQLKADLNAVRKPVFWFSVTNFLFIKPGLIK